MEKLSVPSDSDYIRYRQVSFYFETSLEEAWEAFGADWSGGDRKPLLIRLASNCFRSGIDEEDTVKWTILHLSLEAYEPEVRLTVRNQYRILSGFGSAPCVCSVQERVIRMEEFMKRRYQFRYNMQTKSFEYREKQSFAFDFRPFDDSTLPTLLLNARKEGLQIEQAEVEQYLYSDRTPRFSPLESYLRQLPIWDGKDRIRALAASVPCRCPLWREFFFRWFVRLVAHWLDKDTDRSIALYPLLVGAEGLGKTAFCRRILPPELRSLFTQTESAASLGKPSDAFFRFALIHFRLVKGITSEPEVARAASSGRYASLIATRYPESWSEQASVVYPFIPFEIIGPIRLDHPVDYEQLYAQALQALHAGERYWSTAEEEKKFR